MRRDVNRRVAAGLISAFAVVCALGWVSHHSTGGDGHGVITADANGGGDIGRSRTSSSKSVPERYRRLWRKPTQHPRAPAPNAVVRVHRPLFDENERVQVSAGPALSVWGERERWRITDNPSSEACPMSKASTQGQETDEQTFLNKALTLACDFEANEFLSPRPADSEDESGLGVVELVDTSDHRYFIRRDAPAWQNAFESVGIGLWEVSRGRKPMRSTSGPEAVAKWDIRLCEGMTNRYKGCFSPKMIPHLRQNQRVAMIPGMRQILWKKDGMCDTIRDRGLIPTGGVDGAMNSATEFHMMARLHEKYATWPAQHPPIPFPYSMPCYILPRDEKILKDHIVGMNTIVKATTNEGYIDPLKLLKSTPTQIDHKTRLQQRYMVKPLARGEGHGLYVADTLGAITSTRNAYIKNGDSRMAQPFLADPFLIGGRKFDLRTYVLITSISPLRAYFYDEGLVRFAAGKYNRNTTKEEEYLTNTSVNKKFSALKLLTWTFRQLREWFNNNGHSAAAVFASIYKAVVSLLLAAEPAFRHNFNRMFGMDRCDGCYHLIGVDVIFDNVLNPIVIEVNGLPSMQLGDALGADAEIDEQMEYTATKRALTADVVSLIYRPTSVAAKLASELAELKVGIGGSDDESGCDRQIHTTCITPDQLKMLARGRREFENRGAFSRIFPSPDCAAYGELIKSSITARSKFWRDPDTGAPIATQVDASFGTGGSAALHDVSCRLEAMLAARERHEAQGNE